MDFAKISMITRKINSRLDLDVLLTTIMDTAKEILDAEGASLLLNDEKTGDLIFNVVIGEKGRIIEGERIPRGKGIAGTVAETGDPLIVDDVSRDPRFFGDIDRKSSFTTRNILCLPMMVMGNLIGVLEVVNAIDRDRFTTEDLERARFLADQAAIAIDNRRLNDELHNRIHELTTLYHVSQNLSLTHKGSVEIFSDVISSLSALMKARRASLFVEVEGKNRLMLLASSGLPSGVKAGRDISLDLSSITGHVFSSGDPLIVIDTATDLPPTLKAGNSDYLTGSFISVPVVANNRILGVLNLSDKHSGSGFDAYDLRVLSTVATHIGEAYMNHVALQITQNSRRLENEINIAAEIQRKIIPAIPPRHAGHTLAAYNMPATVVGGDFYDFFIYDENKYGVMVADVSGKGIPAAMFMGVARNIIRSESRFYAAPGRLLSDANRYIWDDSEHGMFVTLFYAVIDSHNSLITYGSAGHNNQFLFRVKSKTVDRLNAKGRPLGITRESVYEEKITLFEKGDLLFLCTDGVIEILDEDQDIARAEKVLAEILAKNADQGPAALIEIFRSMQSAGNPVEFDDDFTILSIMF